MIYLGDNMTYEELFDQIKPYPSCENMPPVFYALGLAGEAGEYANVAKKRWRDGGSNEEYKDKLKEELADVLMYVILCSKSENIDLKQAVIDKLDILKNVRKVL